MRKALKAARGFGNLALRGILYTQTLKHPEDLRAALRELKKHVRRSAHAASVYLEHGGPVERQPTVEEKRRLLQLIRAQLQGQLSTVKQRGESSRRESPDERLPPAFPGRTGPGAAPKSVAELAREHAPSQPQAVAPGRRLETPAAPALFPTPATRSSALVEGRPPQASPRNLPPQPPFPKAGRDESLSVSRPAAPQPAPSSPDWTDLLETLPDSLREALVSILKGLFLFRRIRSASLSGRKGAPGR
jgi:hypothetical protein